MPIYKGLTKIGNIYKGTTPIANVYKGAVLVYSSAKWLSYGFTNLYNSLIPTTIQSRNVLDKLKISKVYGNSVVENQLIDNLPSTQTILGITFVNNNDNTWTVKSGTATGNSGKTPFSTANKPVWIDNHKYLMKLNGFTQNGVKLIKNPNGFIIYQTTIITQNSTELADNYPRIYVQNGVTISNDTTVSVEIIDLTLMFPFDTPTTLTDPRIQALLNRGYIEYNTGEIKSVDISEFSSEPFNIWNEEWEQGTFNTTTGVNSSGNGIRSKNYIKVIPNTSYYCYKNTGSDLWCMYFDENYNVIPQPVETSTYQNVRKVNNSIFTLPNNCNYIRFYLTQISTYNNDICINVSSSLNGTYKPYTQPQTLPFIYQGNGAGTSHDTFEITSSEYVFTKNMKSVDLGTLDWSYGSTYQDFSSRVVDCYAERDNTKIPNIICEKYTTVSTDTFRDGTLKNYTIRLDNSPSSSGFHIRNLSYTSPSDFKQAVSGIYACYQLATPQVIRIPKKHLGIVDLGTLTWSYESANRRMYAWLDTIKTGAVRTIPLYCSLYLSKFNGEYFDTNWEMVIYKGGGSEIYIHNRSYTDPTTFKNAMSGIYLFYETESEVADIEDMIKVEAGGTLTSNSNVLPNVDTVIKCK